MRIEFSFKFGTASNLTQKDKRKSRQENSRLIRENTEREGNGADRDRTGDLRLAKPTLSQLSYSPAEFGGHSTTNPDDVKIVNSVFYRRFLVLTTFFFFF